MVLKPIDQLFPSEESRTHLGHGQGDVGLSPQHSSLASPAGWDGIILGSPHCSFLGLESHGVQMPWVCFRVSPAIRTQRGQVYRHFPQGRRWVSDRAQRWWHCPAMTGWEGTGHTKVRQGSRQERGWPRSLCSSSYSPFACSLGIGEGGWVRHDRPLQPLPFMGCSSLGVEDLSFFSCRHQEGTRKLSLKHMPSVCVFPQCLFKQHQQQRQWHSITQKQSSLDAFSSFLVPSLAASREPWGEKAASSMHRASDAVTVCIHILTAPW